MTSKSNLTQLLRSVALASLLAGLMVLVSAPATRGAPAATTRYVAIDGTDSGTCSTPASRCQSIQYAVNVSNQTGDTILVAAGTYSATSPTVCANPNVPASVVCIVDKQMTIQGGYTTSNWSTPNYDGNLTFIDGGGATTGIRGVFLLGLSGYPANLTMQGFTIQNSHGVGPFLPGDPSGFGGGMEVGTSYVTLRDMKFKNNNVYGQAGAGGVAGGAGLAILNNGTQPGSLLERVTFENNTSIATDGGGQGFAHGALYVARSAITIDVATFTNNKATTQKSGGYSHGGAFSGAVGTMTLRRITATNNQAIGGNGGGGGAAFGGAIYAEDTSSVTISDSYIYNNRALGGNATNGGFGAGGGVLFFHSSGSIDRTFVISNTAQGGNTTGGGNAGPPGGGGVYLWEPSGSPNSVNLTNVIVAENLSTPGTGASNNQGGGGGAQIQGITANLNHVTFARNRLGSPVFLGQGILVLGAQPSPGGTDATVNINNSIIASHTLGSSGAYAVEVFCNSHLTFGNGLFAENTANRNWHQTFGTCVSGNGSMQQAMGGAGFSSIVPPYDYHITVGSDARDQATGSLTSIDIDGNSRPYPSNGTSDYGADEYIGPPPVLTPRSFLQFIIR